MNGKNRYLWWYIYTPTLFKLSYIAVKYFQKNFAKNSNSGCCGRNRTAIFGDIHQRFYLLSYTTFSILLFVSWTKQNRKNWKKNKKTKINVTLSQPNFLVFLPSSGQEWTQLYKNDHHCSKMITTAHFSKIQQNYLTSIFQNFMYAYERNQNKTKKLIKIH